MFDLLMVVLSLGLILFFNMGDGEKAELGGAIWLVLCGTQGRSQRPLAVEPPKEIERGACGNGVNGMHRNTLSEDLPVTL